MTTKTSKEAELDQLLQLTLDTDPYVRPGWKTAGACNGMNPELFFPQRGEDVSDAKEVCERRGPVQAECLTTALADNERFGIWGGTSELQRRHLRRRLRQRAAAVVAA